MSVCHSLIKGEFKEAFTGLIKGIPLTLEIIGGGFLIYHAWQKAVRKFTKSSTEDIRADQNQRMFENLQRLTDDFISVQEGMQLLLDARQDYDQRFANMDSVTSAQLQGKMKDHSKKITTQVEEICNSYAKEIRELHDELTQGESWNRKDLESLKAKVTRLNKTADLMNNDIERISETSASMETELRPLKEVIEVIQLGLVQLSSTIEKLDTEIVALKEREDMLQNQITPLKEANVPMQTDIKQLQELTAPMQTEIKLLKEGVEPIQTEITMLKENVEPLRVEIQQLKEANEPLKAEIKALANSTEPMHKDIKWAKNEAEEALKLVKPLKKMTEQMKQEVKSLTEASESNTNDLKRVKTWTKEAQEGTQRTKEMTTKMKADIKPIKEAALLMQTNIKPLKEIGEVTKTELNALKETVAGFGSSIKAEQDKFVTTVNESCQERQDNLNKRIDTVSASLDGLSTQYATQIRELEEKTMKKLTQIKINTIFKQDGELTQLEHLQEGEGHTVLIWKISGFGGKLLQLIQEDQCIISKDFINVAKGLNARPVLKRGSNSGKIFIHLEFVDDPPVEDTTTLVPFMHYRSYELLDQRAEIEDINKENIQVFDYPRFGMFTLESTRLPYLSDSLLCLTHELEGDNKYVLNDQIIIKVTIKSLDLVYKDIKIINDECQTYIYNVSRKIQFDLEGRRQRIMTDMYRTTEMGYVVQMELLFNQNIENYVYIIPNLKFLLGKNDHALYCPIAGELRFDLLDQSETPRASIFDKFEYGIKVLIRKPDSRVMDDVRMPHFILQSALKNANFCLNDTILVKFNVRVY